MDPQKLQSVPTQNMSGEYPFSNAFDYVRTLPKTINHWSILKLTVTIVLIIYIFNSIGFGDVVSTLGTVNPGLFGTAVTIGIGGVVISSKRWHVILQAKDVNISFVQVFNCYYIGVFFNLFLPSTAGGDVVKAFKISTYINESVEAYSSVFIDRLTGLSALLLLALVGIGLGRGVIGPKLLIAISLVFVGSIVLGLVIFSKKTYHMIQGILSKLPVGIGEKISELHSSVHSFRANPRPLFTAVVLSILFQLFTVLIYKILSVGLGIQVPILFFFVMLPVTQIILILPISIQGYGVRELLFIYFLADVGVSPVRAVTLSILIQALILIKNSLGGLVLLISVVSDNYTGFW